MRGLLITFEGGEGVGKSTQIERLRARLERSGAAVAVMREPGGTLVGDAIRAVLLDCAHEGMDPWTEVFLYEASRAELVEEVMAPALDAGRTVLCDRFTDSTLAYQGYGRGLELDTLRMLNERATSGLTPDVTVLLDLDPIEGVARATQCGTDRLEAEEQEFHLRVRDGFLALAAGEPERFVVVPADGEADEVEARVLDALARVPALARLIPPDDALS